MIRVLDLTSNQSTEEAAYGSAHAKDFAPEHEGEETAPDDLAANRGEAGTEVSQEQETVRLAP